MIRPTPKDFSTLMYVYGDSKHPVNKSAVLMSKIVRDQMNLLLVRAEEIACMRKSTKISHKELLFILRKNRVKLKRLIKHLLAIDLKSCENGESETTDFQSSESGESETADFQSSESEESETADFQSSESEKSETADFQSSKSEESETEESETADFQSRENRESETADLKSNENGESETTDLKPRESGESETADLKSSESEESETADLKSNENGENETADLKSSESEESETADLKLSESEERETADLKSSENGENETAVVLFMGPNRPIRSRKKRYFKMCMDFLYSIEDCEEFTSVLRNTRLLDMSLKKRKMRQQWRMNTMPDVIEQEEYVKTCKEISSSFLEFKKWLLLDKITDLDLTDCAVSIMEFSARETVAEIIDMILLQRINKAEHNAYLLQDYRNDLARDGPQLKPHHTSKEIFSDYPSAKRRRISKHIVQTDSGFIHIKHSVKEIQTKTTLIPGFSNDALSDVSNEKDSVYDNILNLLILDPNYENISTESDEENSSDKSDNSIKGLPEGSSPFLTDLYTCLFPFELCEYDSSKAAIRLSVSAKKEVESSRSITLSEITEAFNQFQEPSPTERMFADQFCRTRTKLICLLDSHSFDMV